MPRTIQRPEASEGLRNQFDIKGRIATSLDEIIVPTVDVGDFEGSSPFAQRGLVGDAHVSAAAGAARYSGIYITPGAGTILVIHHLRFANVTGVLQDISIGVMRPADVAAVTTTLTSPTVSLNGVMRTTGFAPQGIATMSTFHHSAVAIVTIMDRVASASSFNNDNVYERGVILDGRDPAGPIRLAAITTTLNQGTPWISFYGTEYPVP